MDLYGLEVVWTRTGGQKTEDRGRRTEEGGRRAEDGRGMIGWMDID